MNKRHGNSQDGNIATAAAPALLLASTDAALLTPAQLAERLSVPPTWIKEKTRQRARIRDTDPIPFIKLGKYVRFDWATVQAWLSRQKT